MGLPFLAEPHSNGMRFGEVGWTDLILRQPVRVPPHIERIFCDRGRGIRGAKCMIMQHFGRGLTYKMRGFALQNETCRANVEPEFGSVFARLGRTRRALQATPVNYTVQRSIRRFNTENHTLQHLPVVTESRSATHDVGGPWDDGGVLCLQLGNPAKHSLQEIKVETVAVLLWAGRPRARARVRASAPLRRHPRGAVGGTKADAIHTRAGREQHRFSLPSLDGYTGAELGQGICAGSYGGGGGGVCHTLFPSRSAGPDASSHP
eukprot:gene7775-biopygen16583